MHKHRIHLVSSKGKIPAEVVAHALAQRQKANSAVNPSGTNGSKTNPRIGAAHVSQPPGVAPYPVKPKSGLV